MTFRRLTLNDLVKIRPFLIEKFPVSAMVLNIIDISIKSGTTKHLDDGILEYYGYGDGAEDKMFLVIIMKPQNMNPTTTIYNHGNLTEEMVKDFTSLYDWSKPHMFAALTHEMFTVLEKIAEEKGGTFSKGPAADMYLPFEEALKLDLTRPDLDEEFELDKLQPHHASKVNDHWRYGGKGELEALKKSIPMLGGAAGIFKKTQDPSKARSNDNLVSFIVFTRIGTLNALHTLEGYRGKGLGRWTMEAASKWVAEQGLIPLCEIEHYNNESRRLVEKIGYKLIHDVSWSRYSPKSGVDR